MIILKAKKARSEEKIQDFNAGLVYASYLTIGNAKDVSSLSLILEALFSFYC